MKRPFVKTLREAGDVFLDSFLLKNIVLVQAIGICPIIAIATNLKYGVVLSVCTALVLLPASLFMSLCGDKLPAWLRAPLYTVGAAAILLGAAVFLDQLVSHELYAVLYLFIPLMAVNTLVSYRAGGFSVSHEPLVALADALASSLGFGLVICLVSMMREAAAFGTLWGIPLGLPLTLPEAAMPYAAFVMLGFMAAFLQWVKNLLSRRAQRRREGGAAQ
ncbi:MAG TPA: hypothetical protein H9684_11460 [Firmicutes bacterium]|nr:hypothetical protein [Bacillota bacterium]